MADWMITLALPEHIPPIVADMREADRKEVWASHRHTPEGALLTSLVASTKAWTCLIEGQPAFMWGVAPKGSLLSSVGVPWLLGTKDIHRVNREFLRRSRAYVDLMQEGYARLENHVHAENTVSIRWLQWCGFTVEKDVPELINDEDFYYFWRMA